MELKIQGSIIKIDETQTFDSGFQKREFVIKTDDKYPQEIKFELLKDKCDIIDSYVMGQTIDVTFNIRGSEYNNKHYVQLQAWKIQPVNGSVTTPSPQQISNPSALGMGVSDEPDDLPF